jgi:myo-inositol-1(or 4)-monophosphatase
MTAMTNWKEFQDTGIAAAREAGRVLQEWSQKFTVSEKSRKNLVTEADVNAQDAIFRIIHDKYSDHSFLGEEDLAVENSASDFRWIIDPLDGTTNYVHQFPYYCVSIALEYQGELAIGVIFDPTRDELFTAIRGEGAFLNEQPIHTSDAEELYDAMCVASLPVGGTGDEPQVQQFLNIFPKARSVQRTGSAALNLSYVACGRVDAYWSGTLKPWDQAAGVVIVREAGGQVSKIGGADFDVEQPDMLASNDTPVHNALIEALKLD